METFTAMNLNRFEQEYRMITKDGQVRWVDDRTAVERDAEGHLTHYQGIVVDTTTRKRAEEEIRRLNDELEQRVEKRTTQLQAANQELESFSYSVSHDLRAPLRAIDAYARILEEDYRGRIDDEGCRVLGVVRSEARRMGHLIDHLLQFSRLSRQSLQKVDIDTTLLAREVYEELCRQEPDRLVKFHLSPLPTVEADPTIFRQLWANLLGNAFKFTRGREPADIEVSGLLQGEEVIFFVKDNGAGFEMEYADKLFGVFQRLHGQDEFEGTGVGLALVQRIVHRHGGRTWAEGMLDHGATFYFSLPKRKEDSP